MKIFFITSGSGTLTQPPLIILVPGSMGQISREVVYLFSFASLLLEKKIASLGENSIYNVLRLP